MSDQLERLKRITQNDAAGDRKSALTLAESDVLAVLVEYMDVKKLEMSVEKKADGYSVEFKADVSKFYGAGATSIGE